MKVLNMKKMLVLFLSLCAFYRYTFSAKPASRLTSTDKAYLERKINNNNTIIDYLTIVSFGSWMVPISHTNPSLRVFNFALGGLSLGGLLALVARNSYLEGHSIRGTRPMTVKDMFVDSNNYVAFKLEDTNFLNHFKNTMALE